MFSGSAHTLNGFFSSAVATPLGADQAQTRHKTLRNVTKLRLGPPVDGPEEPDDEASLLDGRFAPAAKTASKAEPPKTCLTCDDTGFRRCLRERKHRQDTALVAEIGDAPDRPDRPERSRGTSRPQISGNGDAGPPADAREHG